MRDIAAPSPRPKAVGQAYKEFIYYRPAGTLLPIPKPRRVSFFRVLADRRSRRPLRPLSAHHLGAVLWFSAKEFARRGTPGAGNYWEHRAVPSAGGCHPIDVLVRDGAKPRLAWKRYNPRSHGLASLIIEDSSALRAHDRTLKPMVGELRNASLLWLLAQPNRTARRYHNPESLIWRDAGVLIGVIALVAEALGLACTPLGATGEPFLSRALGGRGKVFGLGGILIGEP